VIYQIVAYERVTEGIRNVIGIPEAVQEEARRIAGVLPEHDGLGEYPLDEDQAREMCRLSGFCPEPDMVYSLEPDRMKRDS
jgi:hypothetical protein